MSFATRLKTLRLDKGLTQQELAAPSYTAAFVSTIESGRRRPSRAALEHFADRLAVPVEELETGVPRGAKSELQISIQEARALVAAGELDRATLLARDAEAFATEQGWAREAAQARVIRGLIEEQRGRVDEAIVLYASAEEMLTGSSPLLVVDALAGRTRCLQIKGDLRYAIHLLETHLRILQEAGLEDPSALGRIHASLVAAYFDAGLQKQAEAAALKVFELMPLVLDPDRLANMHINTARVLLEQGRYDEVFRSLQKAEELYIDLHWKNDLGRVYMNRGVTFITEGRTEEAIQHLEKAIGIFRETDHVVNEARGTLQLARAHRLGGRTAQAKLVLQGVGFGASAGPMQQGIAHREFGLCLASEGDATEAFGYLESALELFEQTDDARELARTYRVLGDLMREQDSLDAACDAYRNAAMALENAA